MSITTILDTIGADLEEIGVDIENEAEAIFSVIWNDALYPLVKVVGKDLLGDAVALFKAEAESLVQVGVDEVTGLPVGTLITSVLNKALVLGREDIAALKPAVLNALANVMAVVHSV